MNKGQILKRINDWLKENFVSFLILSIFVVFLGVSIVYFNNDNIDSKDYTRDLLIYTSLNTLLALFNTYVRIENYEALKENRKVKTFGFVKQASKHGNKMFLLSLLIQIKITLWTMLFIIPGLVKRLEYQRAVYNMVDYPDMQIGEAFASAKHEMSGRKWDLFLTELITLIPLMLAVMMLFYSFVQITFDGGMRIDYSIDVFKVIVGLFAIFGIMYSNMLSLSLEPVFNLEINKISERDISNNYSI